ncbi:hypothetical protein KCU73_g1117, partial [Aureobasidium melanogenum]
MSQEYDWLVQTPAIAADRETRVNVRPIHLAHNKPLIEGRKLLFGGPSLAHQPESPDADLPVNGSIMLVRAATAEEVRDMVRQDPYAQAGFWDAEKAIITPFRCVLLRQSKQTILVFGPQSLSFDLSTLKRLKAKLHTSDSYRWILDALIQSLARWNPLTNELPQLKKLDTGRCIDELINYLMDESSKEINSVSKNAVLTPLVVAGHLVQYQDYQVSVKIPMLGHVSPTIGFCIGLLTASAVTASQNRESLHENARNAMTLAMLVGGIVDSNDESQPDGPWQSLAVAWAKSGEEKLVEQVLSSIPQAYISVHYDWNRATITLPKTHVAEAQIQFTAQGFTTNVVALHGCFHLLGHQKDYEALVQLACNDQFLCSTQATFEPAIRDILVNTSNWYDTVRESLSAFPSAAFLVFGLEKCIPPSLIREIGPQNIIMMNDLDVLSPQAGSPTCPELRPGSSADDIAVISMACKFAGSDDVNEFWDTLMTDSKNKRTWYGNFLRDHEAFDHKFFKKSPREAASMDPQQRIMLQNLAGASFLSPTGPCKPFDANADGYCRGEGVAAVMLKRLSAAVADGDQILGCIAATEIRQNMNCTPIVVPNVPSLSSLFESVLHKAGLQPGDISVVEAHGTGTPVGDPAEWDSIRTIMGGARSRQGNQNLVVGSVKGHIGHTECTSGVAALIKILVMMHAGKIPPQASFNKLNPALQNNDQDQMEVATTSRDWTYDFRAALINNYGASGSNASMIITQPFKHNKATSRDQMKPDMMTTQHPFMLSGNDLESIRRNASRLLDWMLMHPQHSLSDIAFNNNRKNNPTLDHAASFQANTLTKLQDDLRNIACDHAVLSSTRLDRPVILCFGGQISTSVSINRVVYDNFFVYRNNVDACDRAITSLGLRSIFPYVFDKTEEEDPVSLQTKLFAIQYASAKSWIDCGLNVVAAVGHSFGELTALCVTGVLTLEDTIKVVSRRAKVVKESWGEEKGAMLAIEASLEEVHSFLDKTATLTSEQNVIAPTIACHNGPTSFTIAGSIKAIDAAESIASKMIPKPRIKRLKVTNAFHSTLVGPLMAELLNLSKDIKFKKGHIPLMHSTESLLEQPDKEFVANHLRNPVYFHHALTRLGKLHPSAVYLEAGTNSTVTNMASRALGAPSDCHFQAVNLAVDNAVSNVVDVTVALWKAGLRFQYWAHHQSQTLEYAICMLPPRQFAKSSHWLELKQPSLIEQIESDAPVTSDEAPITALWSFLGFDKSINTLAKFKINTHVPDYEMHLSGHIVAQEAPICPATLQIHIVVNAVKSLRPAYEVHTHRPVVKDVSNQAPICRNSSKFVFLEAEPNLQHEGEWSWRIFSTETQGSAETTHVSGLISFRPIDDKDYGLDFARFTRLVSHDRCKQLLQNLSPDDTITGRNIYRAFSDVVDYGDLYRCLKKLVGKGTESAGQIMLRQDQDSWFDTIATDCFSQVGGIWVNCMTDRSQSTLYIANGIEQWLQSPKARSETDGPRVFDVFATHHKVSKSAYCTDVFVFDSETGELSEVVFGISYVEVSKVSMQKMLSRLTSSNQSHQVSVSVPVRTETSTQAYPLPASINNALPTMTTVSAVSVQSPSIGPRNNKAQVSDKLKDIIGDLCGLEKLEIKDDAQLADLGVDSLMSMELLKEIETAFKITIPEEDRVDVVDLASLVIGVSSLVSGNTPDSYQTEPDSEDVSDATDDTSVSSADEVKELRLHGTGWLTSFEEMNMDTDSCIAEYGFADYLVGVNTKQTELCICMILEALEKLGRGLTAISPGGKVERVDHIVEHKRLVDYLYHILNTEAGLIESREGQWVRTSASLPNKTSEAVLQELHHSHPGHSDAFELAYHCGTHLAEVLEGTETGVKLIFGSTKGRDLVSKLYGNWPLNVLYYDRMASLLEQIATRLPRGQGPLKILEMGAGTAGTTKILLPRLAKLGIPIEYTFTDLSPSFVAAARKQFKQYGFMRFRAHDIEKAPADDLVGSQHLVIASNAVHATHDLAVSAANIKQALQPGGALLMLEMTKPVVFIDIIFGLFEGWWLFDDGRDHAISHQDRWDRVLRSVGFDKVIWTDGKRPENEIERLILAVNADTRYDNVEHAFPVPTVDLPADLQARRIAVEAYVDKFCQGWTSPTSLISNTTVQSGKRVVMITGATGSLGTHLVAHVSRLPDVWQVVCVNRRSRGDPMTRQLDALRDRKIHLEPSISSKLIVYESDTSKDMLGLEKRQWAWLANHVTHICHDAWPMSAQRPVDGFQTQFQVMRNLIDLATVATSNHGAVVSFEFVSSIAVVGHYPLWTGRRRVPEKRMCIRSVLPNGYGDAKYVCETMLDSTLRRHPSHFRAFITRPGQIAGSKLSGIWNTTEHLSFLVKSCQTLQALPAFEGELSWTPVEDVAGTCADLLLTDSASHFVYHIDNPVRQPWAPMIELWADALNIPLSSVISFDDWIGRVHQYTGKPSENPASKLLEFLDKNFTRMSCGGLVLETIHSVHDSKTLAAAGPINDQVARRYLEAWMDCGYLKR